MNKKNKGFTTIELITSFTLASVIMLILFNIILILKDNLSKVNAKTNMLINKDNLSYNINKRFKEKELSSVTLCDEGDKCYEFTYSDDTSDKLIYSNTDKTITFNNYTFDIIDGITVEEPTITEHYDTMSSTKYNGYFIIHIPIKIDNKDYSIKINKHFNTDSFVIDLRKSVFDKSGNRYVLVEYLESTGTQYIDTEIKTNGDLKVLMDFEVSNTSNTQFYFGSRIGVHQKSYTFLYYSNRFRSDYSNQADVYTGNIESISGFPRFKIDMNKNITKIINNNYNITYTYSSFESDLNIYLFAINQNGKAYSYSSIKLYSFKLYDNDTLVRDFIPVIDSNSKPCLFDKVSRECYYNQGTGEFLYG